MDESQARLTAQTIVPQATAAAAPKAAAEPAKPVPSQATIEAASDVTEEPAERPAQATVEAAPQGAAEPLEPEQPHAKAGPTTRPIVGVDDEPALANAPANSTTIASSDCLEVVPVIPADLPKASSFTSVRPVSFVDDAGLALQWPMNAVNRTQGLPTVDVASGPSDAALMQAIVCYATSRGADVADSVADLDLASLRWAAWTDAVSYLKVDVTRLGGEDLHVVLSKWLSALNELESLMPTVYGATAYADDM